MLHQRICYGSSFQTVAVENFTPTSGGTRVDVRFGQNWRVTAFLLIWTVYFAVATLLGLLTGDLSSDRPGLLGAMVFVVSPTALSLLGRWLARGEEAYSLRFLRGMLHAG